MKPKAILICLLLGISAAFTQTTDLLKNVPDRIEIGLLENIFKPVLFDHKLHAEMIQPGEGCVTCHHHAPDSVFQSCADCHVSVEEEASLNMPTINGAYHRNCLNCHQDWMADHVCETCHVKNKWRFNPRKSLDATDVLAYHHKEIVVPEIFHFVRPESQEKPVSFHHKEHVELYRYKCEHCHRQTNCANCHNSTPPPVEKVMTLAIHHEPCGQCHDTESKDLCGLCHRDTPSAGFTHATTGWGLNRFHNSLDCQACHGGTAPIQALDTDCLSCHDNFEVGSFDHRITGVKLNEDHEEIDCYECHIDDRYDRPPYCVDCHDEDMIFPAFVPGERLTNQIK